MQKDIKHICLKLLFLVAVAVLPTMAAAQAVKLKGTVVDGSGEPLIGATVQEKGAKAGTVTDLDGKFTLEVSGKASLQVSYIGFDTKTVPVNGQTSMKIVMEDDNATALNEVVVVGYGTMRKSDLTGAVGSLDSKKMKDRPVSNVGEALQGKVAGLQVVDAGKPGDNVSIKVRGLGSINSCDPLVVIDGIPTDLGLNCLNMSDIDRVDVLKDASATAIYGSRGANGVVLITTKKGQDGDSRLNVSANVSIQRAHNLPTLLNASEYAALSNDMMENAGHSKNPDWVNPSSVGTGTNWLDEILRTGVMQNYTLSYSGGSQKAHYYISGGFLNQTGIVKSVGYRRFTLQANADAQVKKWLKLSNNITFSTDTKNQGSYSISDAMTALPIYGIYAADGTYDGPVGNSEWFGSVRNPVGNIEMNKSNSHGYNLLINASAEITFCKWLKFKSTFGYDAKWWYSDSFTPAYDWKPTPVEQSSRWQSNNKSFTYLWDNYFTFDHTFGKNHHVSLMAGSSAQWNTYDYLNAQMNIFPFEGVHEMDNGEKMYSIGGNKTEWALLSWMARANYNYADRYMLTATVRRDGSSRFRKDHRWGTFPSVAAAWRASSEPWFPKIKWINNVKVRAGYGVTGSQASVSNYAYLAQFSTSVYPLGKSSENQTALVNSTLANPDIHWESVRQTNIGLDLAVLDSRISLSLDYYWKETYDMLVKASIPITSGYEDTSTTYTNSGKVSNRGLEITLNTQNIHTKDWEWQTTISATYNKNKIKDLNSDTPYYINQLNNSYVTMLANGYPINVFYGYVTDGIFQTTDEVEQHAVQKGAEAGDIRFKDLNNDGVINDDDRTIIGNPNPTWLFSMGNTVTWKNLEFSLFLQGVAGNKIYNYVKMNNTGMFAAYNQTSEVLDRWTGYGTSDAMPRAVYGDPNQNARVSDRYVENGSYLRVKNMSLAYNFPKRWLNPLRIENARLNFSCENLVTFTKYSGIDPEVGINGIDYNSYPISRTFSFGLNVTF